MATFLIQVSGKPMRETAAPEYIEGAKGPLMCDEPLVHGEYFNATPYWKEEGFGRYEAWQTVDAGDQALLYCTSSVDDYGSSLSHLLKVESASMSQPRDPEENQPRESLQRIAAELSENTPE